MMSKKLILVVDDNTLTRMTVKVMLEHSGYEITEACNGAEGVNRFIDNPDFSLILTDFQMPEMTGGQMSLRIYQIDQDVPIIS